MKRGLIFGAALVLAGCNTVSENVQRANQKIQKSFYDAAGRVQGWTHDAAFESYHPAAPQTAFCYRGMGDIVCYSQPQTNMTNKLVGYQGYATTSDAIARAQNIPDQALVLGANERLDVREVRPVKRTPINAIPSAALPFSQRPMHGSSALMQVAPSASASVLVQDAPPIASSEASATPVSDPKPLIGSN